MKITFNYIFLKASIVSDDSLEALHSIFGDILIKATVLLENRKVFVYHLEDFSRSIIKLIGRKKQHFLFSNINFCRCDSFKNEVLEGRMIVCEHILAVKLAEISGSFKTVLLTDLQMKDMLNNEFLTE